MTFIMDRDRLPVKAPAPFGPDEFLLGRFTHREILKRVRRSPYRQAFARLMTAARRSARVDLAARTMHEAERAHYAQALAFSAWLTGSKAHRRRAAIALEAAGSGHWGAWTGAAETLNDYALAFDFLRPLDGLGRRDKEHFVERVGEKLAGGIAVNAQLPQNNWNLCTLSSIGMMSLALWHEQTPWPVADWLEVVADGLSRLLFGLVSPEGVYLEGAGYSRRASVGFLPFAWACTLRGGVDLINFPPFARWMRWLAEFLYPDGTNPPMDDTGREALHPFALLCHRRCEQARLFRWAADRQGHWHHIWDLPALLLYDDRIRPQPPETTGTGSISAAVRGNGACPPSRFPSRIWQKSGVAVLRSDWSKGATCGVLVARPLPPLGPGQADSAHRHDDPTNFLIYANGEPLTTEAGYGQWDNPHRYTWFLQGEAHNLILVDGQGPPRCTYYRGDGSSPNVSSSNGRVRRLFAGPDLVVVRAETDYNHVEFRRTLAFVRNRYFVVLDVVDAAAAHSYEWVLHGCGRLVAATPETAVWRTTRSWLAVRWIAPAGLRVTRHKGMDQENWTTRERHDYVKAATSGKRAVYLTVLVPGKLPPPREGKMVSDTISDPRSWGQEGRKSGEKWCQTPFFGGVALPEIRPLGLESPAVGVSIRQGRKAEHFAFNPWGSATDVPLPGRRGWRLAGFWGALFEEGGRLTPRGALVR